MTPPREPRTGAAEAVCNGTHAFVMHTGRPVTECPLFRDHLRMADLVMEAAGAPLREALQGLVDTWDLYGTTEVNQWGDKAVHQPWIDALHRARAALAAPPAPAPLDVRAVRAALVDSLPMTLSRAEETADEMLPRFMARLTARAAATEDSE